MINKFKKFQVKKEDLKAISGGDSGIRMSIVSGIHSCDCSSVSHNDSIHFKGCGNGTPILIINKVY